MSEPRNTERVPAPERVYRELRRAILEGAIAPGERLTTMSLAERLGVSRTPIRAALVRLQADGLVDSEGGRSARVRPLTVDEVEQAYDVAMGLEGVAVYRLAQHADDTQKDDLLRVVSRMETAAERGDRGAWVEADEQFHQLLAELTGNPLLRQVMERVETIIGRLRFMSLHIYPQGAATSAHEHRAVVDAIRDGEPERARQQHHDHWERVRQANVGFLREGFSGSAGYLLTTPPARRPRDEASATD
ncbi:GntR family transcriptional regulator [Jiangella asiatica]|uniref:GntR family transcriptional regulator n=1 Tax=Jiangella asiatica TaxID=2530372 RepID=A0A4V2Z4B2_9ACTN|nr:GntR family transcriptional regulator [Jiangella asiatica]TDE15878.1 GntR family transcriptional regulator [Jiangella asiatica]